MVVKISDTNIETRVQQEDKVETGDKVEEIRLEKGMEKEEYNNNIENKKK